MSYLDAFRNLDLLSVGVTVAAIFILGITVFFNNQKSITNKAFLFFSMATVFYGTVNYAVYHVSSPVVSLFLLRATLFFAVWHAFSFFLLFYVFPEESAVVSPIHKFITSSITGAVSLLTLTPAVLSGIKELSPEGVILKADNGPGIAVFGVWVLYLVISGIYFLVKKMIMANERRKKQFKQVAIGTVITFSLLIVFNFIFPALLDNSGYVPLGALFMFPFIGFTFYAIARHGMLDIKVIGTEIITAVLAIVVLLDVIVAEDTATLILRVGVFILVLGFGALLIKSVLNEVRQREKLEILTEDLEASNKKLQELDKLKSEFLSFASHQVKAPMSIVKGYADLIAGGSYGQIPDKVKETAEKIKSSVDKLIFLVNDFLDLRKIEEGKMQYDFEKADVVDIVKEVSEGTKTLADIKDIELSFEATAPAIEATIDVQKFRQVIQNLVENAVKYTLKGWVKVTVSQQNNFAVITVSDSGLGMPGDLIPTLFEQFHRGQSDKKIRGTGLGLYIAKQIIDAHHGTIKATSEGDDKGSTFIVEIPLNS
ncbi:MAG: ATP-binding protein [bacterium]|nr:ATP-binding protein [bacterium]